MASTSAGMRPSIEECRMPASFIYKDHYENSDATQRIDGKNSFAFNLFSCIVRKFGSVYVKVNVKQFV